jgi:hypothetical protein
MQFAENSGCGREIRQNCNDEFLKTEDVTYIAFKGRPIKGKGSPI